MEENTLKSYVASVEKEQSKGGVSTEENPRHYKAWGHLKSSREMRLNIRDQLGKRYTVPYAAIMLVQYMPPTMLTIICTHFTVTLEGKNLDELEVLLQDEKARYIQAYNAKSFDNEPADDDGFIKKITIKWLRPEVKPKAVAEVTKEKKEQTA